MKFILLIAATLCLGACATCPSKTSSGCCGAGGTMKCDVPKKPS